MNVSFIKLYTREKYDLTLMYYSIQSTIVAPLSLEHMDCKNSTSPHD